MNQKQIVRERLQYHFKHPDGSWNIPEGMPFMKEFLNEVEKLASDGVSASVRLSLPSDAEIHSMADEVSLRQDTRDRMIHAMGLEQGATWIRNNIREQLGSEA